MLTPKNLRFTGLASIMLLSLTQCGNDELKNPGYPDEPSIKFDKIKFIEVGDIADYDTLKFTISYKDGDSDLGLSSVNEDDFKYPYHRENFFLEDGTGDTIAVTPEFMGNYHVINSVPQSGLLVTDATRQKTNYSYLPAYDANSCLNYQFSTYLYVREDLNIIDESFDIEETVNIGGQDFIRISETLLYKQNSNNYNITVKFYVFNSGSFEEFDFFEEYCFDYNGRFPLIEDKRSGKIKSGPFTVNVKTPWEGTLTYSMPGTSWLPIFGDRPMKLQITIKDRALHTSNTIITPEFVLSEIK